MTRHRPSRRRSDRAIVIIDDAWRDYDRSQRNGVLIDYASWLTLGLVGAFIVFGVLL